MIRIDSQKKVIRYTIAISAIAVAAPMAVVGGILALIPDVHIYAFIISLVIAALIPLLIAPPVSYVGLSLLRQVTETLDRVDAQIRFDPLTGVLNRGYFLDQIRSGQIGGALLIVDADHFKKINDNYGHSAGDAALVTLAHAMSKTVGPDGMTARLGGEEFAIFLPGQTLDKGVKIAEAVCANIRQLDPLIEGHRIKMTVSIGCSLHPKSALIGKSLKQADELLYRAKSSGRDKVVHDVLPDANLGAGVRRAVMARQLR
jgi:diguanylate cyclase